MNLFYFSGCIAIRVYVPHSSPNSSDPLRGVTENISSDLSTANQPTPSFFTIEDGTTNAEVFARRSPSLFFLAPKEFQNQYGSLPKLIEREIDLNPKDYQSNEKYKIKIHTFSLLADDVCYKNITSVELHITAELEKSKKQFLDFRYSDTLESRVTDCTFTLASAPLFLGWIIYMPYLGFRGNREDQLNQMGRIAMIKFFENLKVSLPRKK